MKEGHIFTDIPIDLDYPNYIENQLQHIGNVDKIVHHISSPGGSVYAGYKAYHILKRQGKPIKSIVEGEAQSMATFVAMAGDEIIILDPSRWMIHNPSQDLRGDAKTLRATAEELERIENEMAEVYATRTKKPVDVIKAMMAKETKMSAREAVEFGFADSTTEKAIDKQVYETLKAVALGNDMDENNDKTLIQKGFEKIEGLIKSLTPKADPATPEPKAIDLAGADGVMYNVATEDPNTLVGMPITTADGQPVPDGSYVLADGRTIIVAGGVVAEVQEVMSAQDKEIQDLKARLQAAESQKAQTEAREKAIQEAAAKEKEEAVTTAQALAKEVEELKKKTVGDDEPPTKAMDHFNIAGKTGPQALALAASRTFIADHMTWLEQQEVFQKKYPGGKFPDGTRLYDYRSAGGPCAVSILETNLSYTWPGVLATELFFKPTLSSPALSDIFTIDLGSADKKQYHIAPVMNKVLKPYTGCDQAVTGSSYDITSKSIQLKPFEMYEGWCKDDFTKQLTGSYNVLAQEWLKTGTDSFDPAGTPIDRMIVEGLKDALRRDIFRRVSFGDSTSSSADWNQIDGLWQSLIDQSGAANYCVYASKSNFGTGTLSADAALNELTAIYKNSSNLLKEYAIDSGNGRFLVTRSIWDNYYESLVGKGDVSEGQYENLLKGISGGLKFRGIPVVPITIWDDFLADSTNPLYSTTRHLIAFTVKDNHILGVENTADLNKIDSWFEKKDNKRYYRSNMVMGFIGAIHCDLTTISY